MPRKPKVPKALHEYLSKIGTIGGLKGGVARKKILSAKERHEIAVKAARARWAKKKAKGGAP